MSPNVDDDDRERQPSPNRRRVLLGVGAAAAAIAGCTGSSNTGSDGSTDEPTTESFTPSTNLPYGGWLTSATDGMLFAYADLEAMPSTISSRASLDESLEDPLVTYPLVLSQTMIGGGQIRLSFAGLTDAITPDAESESTLGEVTVHNRTTIAEGDFATDKLHDKLIQQTDETWGIAYEHTGMAQSYDQYEPDEIPDSFDDDPPVVAVSEDTVVVGPDASRVQQVVTAGDESPAAFSEASDTLTQLLEEIGTGDLVVGEIGSLSNDIAAASGMSETEPQFTRRSGEDVIASLEFQDSGDTVDSQFGVAADSLTESRQETIETRFGTAASENSVSIDVGDDQITASGTYDLKRLGLTSSEEPEESRLDRAQAAELVAPDALAFQYEPPRDQQRGELWVTVTEDTDAAAIRVETPSGSATELEPQDRPVSAGDSVAAQVDPAGDSVTVSVVNDDGAVGELVTQSVPTDELSAATADQAVPADTLSFSYQPPNTGDYGSLTVEVTADITAETLVAQPQTAPGLFTDRVGSLASDEPVSAGTTLETAVDPEEGEVIVYATVDDATGEVARWQAQ